MARGGDDWPTTWADDDCLCAGYGKGFAPMLPAKLSWMSADGRRCWLVFSGDDHSSMRRATFTLAYGP